MPEPLVNQIRRQHERSGRPVAELLVDMGLATAEQLSTFEEAPATSVELIPLEPTGPADADPRHSAPPLPVVLPFDVPDAPSYRPYRPRATPAPGVESPPLVDDETSFLDVDEPPRPSSVEPGPPPQVTPVSEPAPSAPTPPPMPSHISGAIPLEGAPAPAVETTPGAKIITRPGDSVAEAEVAQSIERERRLRRRQEILPTLVNGPERYELGEEIARGGMGRIVTAVDRNIDRTVVMKLLIRGTDEQLGLQLRFTEEAQITGQLQHPNIVPVYDLGTRDDGQLFFTMKRVEGVTLRDVLRGHRKKDPELEKTWTLNRLLHNFQQVCMAIAYSHSRGVVHRDLKPSNIMFGAFGEVMVMDWGLAKILKDRGDERVKSHREDLSRWATRHGEVIGTPGYMPPELALGQLDDVDGRADVYSLGAILYEILTLRPPYTGREARQVLRKMLRERVVPPRERAPTRNIPIELEEVAMRCLAKDIEQRYGSVLELHDAIEAFLEGAVERERQLDQARSFVAEAKAQTDLYRTQRQETERLEAEVEGHRLLLAPWDGAERRRALWETEERLERARRERVEAFARAAQAYREALGKSPDDATAREGARALYWDAFLLAEREGDRAGQIHYETLLRGLDDGSYAARLEGQGALRVVTDPPGARAVLFTYDEQDKILTPREPRDLGATPTEADPLPMGSYLLALRAPGLRSTQVPVRIERLAEVSVSVRLRAERVLGAGFVYIPGGRFQVGGDAAASWSLPRQTVHVNDFCLARLPVSCLQYLDFLNDLEDREEALARAPRLFSGGGALFRAEGDRLVIPEKDPAGVPWDPNWPVFGVSFADALAYATWRGRRDGRTYRLPSELEWEVAARGADVRLYPWGNAWEPTYCKSAHSRPGSPQLEPCGSFPNDRSPYGAMDMAGGVADWTTTEVGGRSGRSERICRGGAWNQFDLQARCASRFAADPESVSVSLGFRLACDP